MGEALVRVSSAAQAGEAIRLQCLGKSWGAKRALGGIDATLPTGRLIGIVGPDGAGKTTLMRLMAALLQPTTGSVVVHGQDTRFDPEAIHSMVGYMPQRFGLYEDLSVQENLRLYADLKGLRGVKRTQTFERLLHFTRLEPFQARLAGQLSGGMKQKLGLACALMAKPRVLLLDEPSVGVDPVSRQDLWRMVQALASDGMAVVWSTAYLDEAERCDPVLLLELGKLVFQGPPQELTGRVGQRSFRVVGLETGRPTGYGPGHTASRSTAYPPEHRPDRRQFLTEALERPEVRDGVIQGAAVRLVLAESADPVGVRAAAAAAGAQLEPTTPRFEDAFIDLLGGGPGGHSAIAERMHPVTAHSESMVECNHLTKRFGTFVATSDLSFRVRPGEVFGLLGPNGAGKSTAFKMLCGLLKPTEGRAAVAGFDLARSTGHAKRQLGYMAQKFSLYGLLSVKQNLEFFSGAYGLKGTLRRERVQEMIETFDLAQHLNDSPDAIPLGFKQRLALACSLMHRPSVLFLDEPTSGVDPVTRREFWTHITGLVGKGVTILVTTHFMDEAEYCDRVALMHRSRLMALDTPDALKANAAGQDCPDPTMEDAFIRLIEARERASLCSVGPPDAQ